MKRGGKSFITGNRGDVVVVQVGCTRPAVADWRSALHPTTL
jgi:hypothetical protein